MLEDNKIFVSLIQRSRTMPHPAGIGMVFIQPLPNMSGEPVDEIRFNDEFDALIQEVITNKRMDDPQRYRTYDFVLYPTLGQSVRSIEFKPVPLFDTPLGCEWIDFEPYGEAYPPRKGPLPDGRDHGAGSTRLGKAKADE